ncbi:hypothetical protein IGI37_003779 [Enterococcus sp. AZ194]|uniref:hypothetical protein n=1 Tax=Enterococcus sp. AZ194 TaxID=2774629 RepID=UPI003F1F1D0C
MINVIKMDIYRMIHARSTYYTLIGLALFLIFLITNSHDTLLDVQQGRPIATASVGIGFNASLLSDNMTLLNFFQLFAGSKSFILMLSIFSVLFINHEEASGFSKNIAGQVQKRGWLFFSKFICQSVFILACFFVGIVVSFLAGGISYDSVVIGNVGRLIMAVGLQFLFHLAFAGILLLIITLIKQPVISLLISILLCFGAFSFLYQLLDKWLISLFKLTNFTIENYTMTGLIPQVSIQSNTSQLIGGLAIAAIYCLVTVGLSVSIKNKRDI